MARFGRRVPRQQFLRRVKPFVATTPVTATIGERIDTTQLLKLTGLEEIDVLQALRLPQQSISEVNTVATANQASGSTYAITMPTYAAGDLVICHFSVDNSNINFDTTLTAAGWSNNRQRFDLHYMILAWRIMDGSEGSSVTFTFGGTSPSANQVNGHATSYRGVDPTTPVQTPFVTNGSTSPAAQGYSVGPITPTGPLVLLFTQKDSNVTTTVTTPSSGVTKRYGLNNGNGESCLFEYPTTSALTWTTSSGFGEYVAATFALNPKIGAILDLESLLRLNVVGSPNAFEALQIVGGTTGSTTFFNSFLGITGDSPGTASQRQAQSFVAQGGALTSVSVRLSKTGSPTDNVIASLYESAAIVNGAGLTSATPIATTSLAATSVTSNAVYTLTFNAPVRNGSTYWIELKRDGARDASNLINWSILGSDVYTGQLGTLGSGNTWVLSSSDFAMQASFAVAAGQPIDALQQLAITRAEVIDSLQQLAIAGSGDPLETLALLAIAGNGDALEALLGLTIIGSSDPIDTTAVAGVVQTAQFVLEAAKAFGITGEEVIDALQEIVSATGAGPIVVSDLFSRSISLGSGWGDADVGGAWSTFQNGSASNAQFGVDGSAGQMVIGAANVLYDAFLAGSYDDFEALVRVQISSAPTGVGSGGLVYNLCLRSDGTSENCYRFTLAQPGPGASGSGVRITKVVSGGQTDITTNLSIGDLTNGSFYWMRARAAGKNLYLKVWPDGSQEPVGWTVAATDSTFTSGQFGLNMALLPSGTNFATILWDDLSIMALDGSSPNTMPVNSSSGIRSTLIEQVDALQRLAITRAELIAEALQAITQTTGSEAVDALLGIATTNPEPLDAPQGLAITGPTALDALKVLNITGAEAIDALKALTITGNADAFESLKGLAIAGNADAVEFLQGIASTNVEFLESESNVNVIQTAALVYESLKTLALVGAAQAESQQVVQVIGASDPAEVLRGIAASFGASSDIEQGLAVALISSAETLKSVTQTDVVNAESGQGIASTTTVPLEALRGIQSTLAAWYEALQTIARANNAPYETVARLAITALAHADTLARVTQTGVEAAETNQGIQRSMSSWLESLRDIAASTGMQFESLLALSILLMAPLDASKSLTITSAEPVESTQALAVTFQAAAEALQTITQTFGDPIETQNQNSVSNSASFPIEVLQALAIIGNARAESALTVQTSTAEQAEALRGIATLFAAPYESLLGLSITGAAALDSLKWLTIIGELSAESSLSVTRSASEVVEALLGLRATLTAPLSALQTIRATIGAQEDTSSESGVSQTASMPFEALQLIRQNDDQIVEAGQGIRSTITSIYEALRAIARTGSSTAETVRPISSSSTMAAELTQALRAIGSSSPTEAQAGISSRIASPLEAIAALQLVRTLNAESLAPRVSAVAVIDVEALQRLRQTAAAPWEFFIFEREGFVILVDAATAAAMLADEATALVLLDSSVAGGIAGLTDEMANWLGLTDEATGGAVLSDGED
jgi:hypothetical protein